MTNTGKDFLESSELLSKQLEVKIEEQIKKLTRIELVVFLFISYCYKWYKK